MKIYFKMKKYIVIQICVESEVIEGNTKNITVVNIARQVEAENKETAIGKFVMATADIKYIKKLDIECYDLSELKSV